MDGPIPLALVDGFLSAAPVVSWGDVEQFLHPPDKCAPRPVLFPSVGPVSSLHDRACELFYQLKGGRVDYGAAHARECGHARFGREHRPGLYPAWSAARPLHFIAHSLGGPTLVTLTALLRAGFFGAAAHPDMVLSVTAVSAPFRGTQLVYTLGTRVDAAPAVRPLSPGAFLARAVHTLAYLAPLLPPRLAPDLHADARGLSCREASVPAFLRQLWRSDWAAGRDAAPYDCTFAAADAREAAGAGAPHARTWYRSYACVFEPTPRSPFFLPARLIASFDFTALRPRPSWLSAGEDPGAEHRASDGVVPLFSQWHPFPCRAGWCAHDDEDEDAPGVWHVRRVPGSVHHLARAPVWQAAFWAEVGAWLGDVEAAWQRRDGGRPG